MLERSASGNWKAAWPAGTTPGHHGPALSIGPKIVQAAFRSIGDRRDGLRARLPANTNTKVPAASRPRIARKNGIISFWLFGSCGSGVPLSQLFREFHRHRVLITKSLLETIFGLTSSWWTPTPVLPRHRLLPVLGVAPLPALHKDHMKPISRFHRLGPGVGLKSQHLVGKLVAEQVGNLALRQ